MAFKDYSPKKTKLVAGGATISGFADGTFVTASRNTDNTSPTVGAAGDVGITVSADKTGTISFVLMQNAPSNRALAAIQQIQDRTGNLIRFPISVMDPSGSMLMRAVDCHIMTPPELNLADDQQARTWVFYSEFMEFIPAPEGFEETVEDAALIDNIVNSITSVSDSIDSEIG